MSEFTQNKNPYNLNSQPVDQAKAIALEETLDLQPLVKGLITQRLTDLKNRVVKEVQELKDRQGRIRLMHEQLRAINEYSHANNISTKSSTDVALDLNDEMFKQLREKGQILLETGESLMAQAEELELEGKTAEAKAMREEASEMIEVARALRVETKTKTFTKEEKDRFVEDLRTTCEDLNTANQLQTQSVSRLNNELHESLLIGRDVMKKVHEIISLMARGIRIG